MSLSLFEFSSVIMFNIASILLEYWHKFVRVMIRSYCQLTLNLPVIYKLTPSSGDWLEETKNRKSNELNFSV